MRISATYYGGARSQGAPVMLERIGDSLVVSHDGESLRHPIADIEIEAPLAGMPRHLTLPDGAVIEADDSPQLKLWFAQTGALERLVDWLERRWPIAVASLAVTAAAAWGIYAYVLPAGAKVAAYNMPQAWEQSIAQGSIDTLRQFGFFKSDIPLERQAAIRARFAPLVAALPDAQRYQLEFRKTLYFGPNAFALPGGRMVVLDALIELTDDDEEIIGVLAHELGHAYHRHAMRNALQSSFLGIITVVAFGDVSTLGSLPLVGLQARYTRGFEKEADVFAIEAMQRANISPEALASMFEKLRDSVNMEGDQENFLSSHPALNDRIKAAREAADADQSTKDR